MKRRNLLATAMAAPALHLATGCTTMPASRDAPEAAPARITVLYDAFGRDGAMQRDWGYSALVEMNGKRVLFDTGNNPDVLAHNAAVRHVDLTRLDFVVMSHRHGDHMGGMAHLLAANPGAPIFAPKETFGIYGSDLPSAFYRKDDTLPPEQRYYAGEPPAVMRFGAAWPQAHITLVDSTREIAPGFHLISLVSDKPGTLELRELSLVIVSAHGLVLLVGCSHPGIDRILAATAAIHPQIRFLAGGFHYVTAKDAEIDALVSTLRDTYKVAAIAPGHCTGEPAFAALSKAFADRYLYAGLGTRFSLDSPIPLIEADASSGGTELQGYEELRAAAVRRHPRLFDHLANASSGPGEAYLAKWRRTIVGCC